MEKKNFCFCFFRFLFESPFCCCFCTFIMLFKGKVMHYKKWGFPYVFKMCGDKNNNKTCGWSSCFGLYSGTKSEKSKTLKGPVTCCCIVAGACIK